MATILGNGRGGECHREAFLLWDGECYAEKWSTERLHYFPIEKKKNADATGRDQR
jgi:hypothetical protein